MAVVPYSAIDPGYGLKTSTVDPDGKVTIVTYRDPSAGSTPSTVSPPRPPRTPPPPQSQRRVSRPAWATPTGCR